MPLLMNPKLALLSQFAASIRSGGLDREIGFNEEICWKEAQAMMDTMPPDMRAALEADEAFHKHLITKLNAEFKDAEGDST